MKLHISSKRTRALTLPEVLVVIAVLAILILVAKSLLTVASHRAIHNGINCVSNLKQVDLSFLIWAQDHDNKYPLEVSVTNGGSMELIARGDVAGCLQVISNELSTTKILICPEDTVHTVATNFGDGFGNSNISYFIGVDITNNDFPKRVLIGDDNLLINGSSVRSGLVQYSTNTSIAWGPDRHKFVGNIGFADGSVAELSSAQLQAAFVHSDVSTNRLAIP